MEALTLLRSAPALLLVACMSEYRPSSGPLVAPPVDTVQKPKLDSYLFTDSLRDIRFLVSTHMHMSLGVQCQVEEMSVSERGAKEPYQRLSVENMLCPCPMPDGQFPGVQLMDLDFDGIRDVRIMKAAKDLTQPAYRHWLWDATAHRFAPSAILDSIQDPMFDGARRMVSSQWYAGTGHRGGSTFRYENGRLVMVSNMEKFTEGDHERWVTWGVKDGRMQPVQEKIMPLPK